MSLSNELRSKIDGLVKGDEIVVFMKGTKQFPQCGFSATVMQILKDLGPKFSTVNVLTDPEIRQGIKDYTGWPTIPQVYVKGEFIGGSDIVRAMYESGELQEKLGVSSEVKVPVITLTDSAAAALKSAMAEAESDDVLFLSIAPTFEPNLGIGPANPATIAVEANGLTFQVDRGSAGRADGVTIDYVSEPQPGFRIDNPNEPPRVKEISPAEVKAKLDAGDAFEFLDVRGEDERAQATIGAVLFDDDQMERLEELDPATTIVFHCHHGGRSFNAASHFVSLGFRNVYNMVGGIDAWSVSVDTAIPRY